MAHGVMEEWKERDKSPAGAGRVMGSRRIFAPQFKLQVLDSYRQDADCKGNQRATARKYGIHRRQIQKWLQMESHLRSITTGSSSPVPVPVASPVSVPSPSPSAIVIPSQEPTAALNLSCESGARLLGGSAGCLSPVGSLSGSPTGSLRGSPVGSPAASPVGSPAPQVVPRPSVSPTLPIKKRWCPEYEAVAAGTPSCESVGSPLGTDEDDDDEEDIDVDGTESEASSSPSSALDYTSATLSKRRSFSLQFKLEVLDAFHTYPLCQGNQRATARAFGINRRQVQKWLGQESDLREEAVGRGGLNRQRLGRWMDQDQDENTVVACLDLSRKRKSDRCGSTDRSDADDSETDSKKARLSEPSSSPGFEVARGGSDAASLHPHLPPHPLLFRPQPLPLMPLPLIPPFPLNFCEMRCSLDLKMGPLDLYTAHQQNLQKWLKQEDLLKHSNSAFLLNSFR